MLAKASHALKTELTAALEGLGISPRARIVGLDKTTMVVTLDGLARLASAP